MRASSFTGSDARCTGTITCCGSTVSVTAGTSSSGYVATPVVVACTDCAGFSIANRYELQTAVKATRTSGGGYGRIASFGELGALASGGIVILKFSLSLSCLVSSFVAVQPVGTSRLFTSRVHFTGTIGFPTVTSTDKSSPATSSWRSACASNGSATTSA